MYHYFILSANEGNVTVALCSALLQSYLQFPHAVSFKFLLFSHTYMYNYYPNSQLHVELQGVASFKRFQV